MPADAALTSGRSRTVRVLHSSVLPAFILCASLIQMLGANTHYHNADSLLQPIISIKKLTWYAWEQNRFANVLPWLASPFRGVVANFYVQLLLRQISGFLTFVFALLILGGREHLSERFYLSVLLTTQAAGAFIPDFFGAALAQPVSCAVCLPGFWLLERTWSTRIGAIASWLLATATFWLAFTVNISLGVLMVLISAAFLACRIPSCLGHLSTALMMPVSFSLAWLHSQFFEPRMPTGLHPSWASINPAITSILTVTTPSVCAAVLIGTAVVFGLRLSTSASTWSIPKPSVVTSRHCCVTAVLAITALLYGSTVWVQMNHEEWRYFSVMIVFSLALTASWTTILIDSAIIPMRGTGPGARTALSRARLAWQAGLPIAALWAVAVNAGPPGRPMIAGDNHANPYGINQDLPRILSHVPYGKPMIVVGNYWTAVPLVFTRLSHKGGRESFAVTDHWAPMRPDIIALLQSGSSFALVCLSMSAQRCAAMLQLWAGMAPPAAKLANRFQETLAGIGDYSVQSLDPAPSAR